MIKFIKNFWNDLMISSQNSMLNSHYQNIIMPTATTVVILLLPFVFKSFLEGHYLLSIGTFLTVIALSENAFSIYKKKPSLIPLYFSSISLTFSLNLSIYDNGINSAFWCFPTIIINAFFFSRKFSTLYNVILFLSSSFAVYWTCDFEILLRFTVCMLLMLIAMNFILIKQENLYDQLIDQSIKDYLTDTYNRRLLNIRLNEAIEQKKRKDTPATILLFDLDNFKQINDRFGHNIGDQILIKISAMVKSTTRKYDTLFRMGGEEFLLFMPDTTEEKAEYVAEKIRKITELEDFDIDFPVTVTIGLSEIETSDTVESWIESADNALYFGKSAGRNCTVKRNFSHEQLIHISYNTYTS